MMNWKDVEGSDRGGDWEKHGKHQLG